LESGSSLSLICRVGSALCALPIESAVETLRPLPIEPVTGAPPFVLGMAIVRGKALPVVDLARLIMGEAGRPTRFLVVKTGGREVVLAVDTVIGVREIGTREAADLPPLLAESGSAAVTAVGALDRELFLVLQTGRLLPEGVLHESLLEEMGGRLAS
jgi:purine-binding chemotaxis protein CheW